MAERKPKEVKTKPKEVKTKPKETNQEDIIPNYSIATIQAHIDILHKKQREDAPQTYYSLYFLLFIVCIGGIIVIYYAGK